jgi:hypothetical protein
MWDASTNEADAEMSTVDADTARIAAEPSGL